MPTSSILVPLDGSKDAENALPLAAKFSAAFDHPLRIVHVLDSHQSDEDLAKAKEQFAGYGAELAKRHGLAAATTFEVLAGNAAETLAGLAEDAAFVVIASHGRGGFRAMIMGSVADKVVRTSNAPVIVVPAAGEAPTSVTNVMVALDGSDAAELALGPARRIASSFAAKLILLRAFNPAPAQTMEFGVYPAELPGWLEEDAKTYLAQTAQAGERTCVAMGDATTAIVDSAKDLAVDFVIMTASGKGAAKRLVLGSTTNRVLHSLHRPLMVIPHHDE